MWALCRFAFLARFKLVARALWLAILFLTARIIVQESLRKAYKMGEFENLKTNFLSVKFYFADKENSLVIYFIKIQAKFIPEFKLKFAPNFLSNPTFSLKFGSFKFEFKSPSLSLFSKEFTMVLKDFDLCISLCTEKMLCIVFPLNFTSKFCAKTT